MAVSKVILNGTTLIDTTDKTVTAGSMLNGVTALKNDGTTATGSIASKSSADLTASGATVTAPAGYYASAASKTVSSGTAGTPTASKGTVSNHSISVTPSVTNTTGYISGGTKSGTAVTVSASELVSGTKSITENGTGINVVNYAAVDVAVESGGGSSYELIYSTDVAANTTSTSNVTVATLSLPPSAWTKQKMIYVRIRDKAGKRDGYFYGTDCFLSNEDVIPVIGTNASTFSGFCYRCKDTHTDTVPQPRTIAYGTYSYGVYAATLSHYTDVEMRLKINARYHSTNSLTIDGTYSVEVYFLDWPNGSSPYTE